MGAVVMPSKPAGRRTLFDFPLVENPLLPDDGLAVFPRISEAWSKVTVEAEGLIAMKSLYDQIQERVDAELSEKFMKGMASTFTTPATEPEPLTLDKLNGVIERVRNATNKNWGTF